MWSLSHAFLCGLCLTAHFQLCVSEIRIARFTLLTAWMVYNCSLRMSWFQISRRRIEIFSFSANFNCRVKDIFRPNNAKSAGKHAISRKYVLCFWVEQRSIIIKKISSSRDILYLIHWLVLYSCSVESARNHRLIKRLCVALWAFWLVVSRQSSLESSSIQTACLCNLSARNVQLGSKISAKPAFCYRTALLPLPERAAHRATNSEDGAHAGTPQETRWFPVNRRIRMRGSLAHHLSRLPSSLSSARPAWQARARAQ